ncbi:Growth-regulating factor 4 [Datura stramonium]|uniref:Growth-regulating factor 4 n=1 Tax=Datura stramonium TaxID=4076 RepID=A0ABS8WIP4_DATST|nr:Growth-regulating factor 4 [Datura stramonium]
MAGEDNNLQVLNALDLAKTQLYHFTAIIIAGMGFFTDAYDLFSISLVTKLFGVCTTLPDLLKPGTSPIASSITSCALSDSPLEAPLRVLWPRSRFRCVWLWILASYTILSATIMSEYANKKTRGAFIVKGSIHRATSRLHLAWSNSHVRSITSRTHLLLAHEDARNSLGTARAKDAKRAAQDMGKEVYKIARAQTLIAICSTVPGYWFTVALIDINGRFAIQLLDSSS